MKCKNKCWKTKLFNLFGNIGWKPLVHAIKLLLSSDCSFIRAFYVFILSLSQPTDCLSISRTSHHYVYKNITCDISTPRNPLYYIRYALVNLYTDSTLTALSVGKHLSRKRECTGRKNIIIIIFVARHDEYRLEKKTNQTSRASFDLNCSKRNIFIEFRRGQIKFETDGPTGPTVSTVFYQLTRYGQILSNK